MPLPTPHADPADRAPRTPALLLALVAVCAALPLFWRLGARYLWQDEAACAVLAERFFATGRPRSYDGTNLITMDVFDLEHVPPTESADAAVRYFLDKGDFKADTSWIGQPWGQFVLAGASLRLFGHGTLQARAPFALAAVVTVVVLFAFVRRRFRSTLMAVLAAVYLLGNTYWFLHARQCRYYAISSLFLLVTLASYLRWRDGRRSGAAAFVASAWCYFQSDFGSFWPVLAVLGVHALATGKGRRLRDLGLLATLGATVLPFVFFYEMLGRLKPTSFDWYSIQTMLLALANRFLLPFAVLPALALLRWLRPRRASADQWRVVALSVSILVAQLLWMPAVGPHWFYRYVVDMTPLAALLVAFLALRSVQPPGERGVARGALAAALGAFLFLSPWPARLCDPLIRPPERYAKQLPAPGRVVREELAIYADTLFAQDPDPNRAVVEYLEPRLRPGDEILVNYEDVPLMFYLPGHPIRGGIPCFRVEVPEPPRFAVMRPDVAVSHWEVYFRSVEGHRWRKTELEVPGVTWGNNPDPLKHYSRTMNLAQPILVYEYVETK